MTTLRNAFPNIIKEPKPFKPWSITWDENAYDERPIEEQIEEAERQREERHEKGEPH